MTTFKKLMIMVEVSTSRCNTLDILVYAATVAKNDLSEEEFTTVYNTAIEKMRDI